MRLLILLVPFLKVALGKSSSEVSGYLGGTVTLPSGADPSWRLSKIVWSIFSNNTWIATYLHNTENVERVSRYKRRLSLNISSGDLTISDLTSNDAMEYSVDLINTTGQSSINKIKLIVTERVREPVVETVACTSVTGGFWVMLRCSSKDKGVGLSWQAAESISGAVSTVPHGSSAALFVFLNATQDRVTFTCTSSRNRANASSVVTPRCDDEKPDLEARGRYVAVFFAGCILSCSLTILMCFLREQIKAAWRSLTAK